LSLDLFDSLLNFTQPEVDDLPINDLLKNIQQDMSPTRYTTPIYEYAVKDIPLLAPAPVVSGDTLEGYAAWWYEKDGSPYIDPYEDWVAPGSWVESIQTLKEQQRRIGNEFLVPHLWQHQKGDQIGSVKHLYEDSHGVVYATKLAMKIRRAQEAYDLAKNGMLGTSYGYDRLEEEKLTHPVTKRQYKKLKKLHAHEISSVTFPANPYTYGRTQAKSAPHFYVPSSYKITPSPRLLQQQKARERLQEQRTAWAMGLFNRAEKILNRTIKVDY
jgi:HK97 family phage prohead protease